MNILLVLLCSALFGTAHAADKNLNPRVMRPQSNAYGRSLGDWAGVWTQWVMAIESDRNPSLDTTGEFGREGQSGRVWFLAGGDNVERTVTIPAGKSLLFPVYNTVWWSEPGDGWDTTLLLAGANAWIDRVDILDVTIDGRALRNLKAYRAESTFSLWMPEDNLVDVWYGAEYPGGMYEPAVADGYWVLLAPLAKGHHELHIQGGISGPDGHSIDVTYHITML